MSICQHANNLCISNCQQSCLKTCQQQQHPFSPGISNSLVIKTVPVFVSSPASRQSIQTTNHFRLAVNICARTHAWDHASIGTGSNHFVIVVVNKLVDNVLANCNRIASDYHDICALKNCHSSICLYDFLHHALCATLFTGMHQRAINASQYNTVELGTSTRRIGIRMLAFVFQVDK